MSSPKPRAQPGDTASRSHTSVFLQLDLRFLAAVHPGDTITGTVEVISAREDKPITELDVRVERDDDTRAVEGHAVCYTVPLPGEP